MVGTFFTLYKGYTWLGKYRLDLNPLTFTQLILAQPTELWSLSSRATYRVDFIAKVNAEFFFKSYRLVGSSAKMFETKDLRF